MARKLENLPDSSEPKLSHSQIQFQWLSFLAAMGLMSRIPVTWFSRGYEINTNHQEHSSAWYPAVGLLLGLMLAVTAWLLPSQWPVFLTGSVCVLVWVAFTGALHLDGLADSADAWVGGMGDQERTLRIMKDPACGPMAVVALVLCLLLKVALVNTLLQFDQLLVLILIPALARAGLLPMLMTMSYAQTADNQSSSGMASDIARASSQFPKIISFVVTQTIACIVLLFSSAGALGGFCIWIAINLAGGIAIFVIRSASNNLIGGYTGDVLGATIEISELVLLFAALFAFSTLGI